MVKLSRKAWNNVIIFSMLILIFLFNSTSNFLNGDATAPETSQLLAQSAQINTLDFGDYKVERIGQTWRAVGSIATAAQLNKLIQAWHDADTKPLGNDVSLGQAEHTVVVQVFLLGQPNPLKFELFNVQGITVVNNGKQLLQLSNGTFNSLTLQGNTDA